MNSKQGSVALVSLLIISAFTLVLVLIASESSVSTYEEYVNDNSDQMMYYSAEGCLEEAILRLENNSTFVGETVNIDPDTECVIAITEDDNRKIIDIEISHLNYTQNFQAVAELLESGEIFNSNLEEWEES
ncbi:MAG: hypothetical protein ACD_65C00011G0003 [uncultured bacterium]|nr:MAG: hypothetical protein ACD_65C00011G0003 [uncultured bacterium]KKT02833.1 MAG: hypothetical protein UV80_C0002G0300 [Candidatus Peregrinibacteria bacterium GW2011_GWF2_43_17]KKT20423.1 MAG: hypothetical protein UW03_C0004G0007 [Candidatus Peregrinibacteria bacterium GW2011_GWA2_43_8]HAU39658.1 hypothetical protein [Candidatus Peregrinibacteria bacterium]